jgi:hypothetical protein
MRRLIMKLQMSALVILVIAGCSDNAVDSVAGGDGGMDAGGRDTGQMDASTDPPSTDALTDAPDTKDADSTKDAGDTEDADNAKDAAREDGGWPDASDASPDASRSDDAGDGGLVEPYRSVTVSSGEDHTCAVRTDGHVLCWGSNALGQLGNGGDLTARRTRPVAVVGIDTATAVAVGDYRSCALERAGTVQCWGYAGPLPDQQPRIVSTPTRVAGIADATAISTGGSHTCVLRAEGSVLCWGSNEFGQLGNATMAQSGGSFVDSPVAVQGLTGATALAAGRAHTCALTNAGISCWGKNQFGELGNGGTRDSNVPVALGPLSGALNIAASVATFVARADGDVSAWGVGTGGLLTPAAGDRMTPASLGLAGRDRSDGDLPKRRRRRAQRTLVQEPRRKQRRVGSEGKVVHCRREHHRATDGSLRRRPSRVRTVRRWHRALLGVEHVRTAWERRGLAVVNCPGSGGVLSALPPHTGWDPTLILL